MNLYQEIYQVLKGNDPPEVRRHGPVIDWDVHLTKEGVNMKIDSILSLFIKAVEEAKQKNFDDMVQGKDYLDDADSAFDDLLSIFKGGKP